MIIFKEGIVADLRTMDKGSLHGENNLPWLSSYKGIIRHLGAFATLDNGTCQPAKHIAWMTPKNTEIS